MRTIQVAKNYEDISIPFGDGTTMKLRADFRSETVSKAMKLLEESRSKAVEIAMLEDASEIESQTAELLAEIVVLIVGEQDYEKLVRNIGGKGAKPSDVNFQMTIIWTELVDMVRARGENFTQSKAAHYLTEYYKAADAVSD